MSGILGIRIRCPPGLVTVIWLSVRLQSGFLYLCAVHHVTFHGYRDVAHHRRRNRHCSVPTSAPSPVLLQEKHAEHAYRGILFSRPYCIPDRGQSGILRTTIGEFRSTDAVPSSVGGVVWQALGRAASRGNAPLLGSSQAVTNTRWEALLWRVREVVRKAPIHGAPDAVQADLAELQLAPGGMSTPTPTPLAFGPAIVPSIPGAAANVQANSAIQDFLHRRHSQFRPWARP